MPSAHINPGMEIGSAFDSTARERIEQLPGKVSCRPIVRGTRILPDAIASSYELGETVEELCKRFPSLTEAQIKRLIEFAQPRRMLTAS